MSRSTRVVTYIGELTTPFVTAHEPGAGLGRFEA